jgi:AcrR family transcriptional regulator
MSAGVDLLLSDMSAPIDFRAEANIVGAEERGMSTTADLRRRATKAGGVPQLSQPRRRNAAATARELLEAARGRFARDGFDRTSIRDIAADVGVDQSLVIRYFGSKERLFSAATSAEPKTYGIFAGPAEELADRLLDWVISIEGAAGESQFVTLLRSSSDEAAIEVLRGRMASFTKQLAAGVDEADAELRADLIASWSLGIAVMRRIVRTPPLRDATVDQLAPYVVPAIDHIRRKERRSAP